MEIQLETLDYQEVAIQSVIKVFEGNVKNTYDNSCIENIRKNTLSLTPEQIKNNIGSIVQENGIEEEQAHITDEKELTIEMETGTGKTLVYLRTIYELFKQYKFTKFIILVPSIAVREGVLKTFDIFKDSLNNKYNLLPNHFAYNSKKLNLVASFIDSNDLQIMIMTPDSFNRKEINILNQAQTERLFNDIPYIKAIANTKPIIIMDEPQNGMDAEETLRSINNLHPLYKIRYSATHKIKKNLLYRLSPYESYKQGLVKKIELLTVVEKNNEASLKLEISEIKQGKDIPQVKLKAWHQTKEQIQLKDTKYLKQGDNLGDITNNPSYNAFTIQKIYKRIDAHWKVQFSNGVEIEEKQKTGNKEAVWEVQLEWLIRRHFKKKATLQAQGIKCLSLIFIDRVDNYIGDDPTIKNIFNKKYKEIYQKQYKKEASTEQIEQVQGYYFARNNKNEFIEKEESIRTNKEIYDAILKDREELLSFGDSTANKIEFIFSHSALGVGWDNPNVFNIATLSNSYSDIKKRQEIGRGLRICVNQEGKRVYDDETKEKGNNENIINQLTVVPNETYETFVEQYQSEIKEFYGDVKEGADITHAPMGEKQSVKFTKNKSNEIQQAFKKFWKRLAQKTDYTIVLDDEEIIKHSLAALNEIEIGTSTIEIRSNLIEGVGETLESKYGGTEDQYMSIVFAPLDIVEECVKETMLSYGTMLRIFSEFTNHENFIKNPPVFIHKAINRIKQIEQDVMLRGLQYTLQGDVYPFDFEDYIKEVSSDRCVDTPNKGVFDKMLIDSDTIERGFAKEVDRDNQVVCFLKLPPYYTIPTPIGNYNPDFGIVMKKRNLSDVQEEDFYFVIETKGTNDINDKSALKESEIYKIKCAIKHFETLGIDIHYKAPIKEYNTFKTQADNDMNKPGV